MNYTFSSLTDPGRIRSNNEDSVVFDDATGVGVLADGMGGYSAGEVASSMATESIQSELSKWLQEARSGLTAREIGRAIEMCVDNANSAIYTAARINPHYSGMGTTLVVGVFTDDQLILGHIGDSRCYRWRDGELVQLTKDHSLLQEQVDAGFITPEQAAVSPNRNLVTRALGVEDAVMLDLNEFEVLAGDLYLMCSDGLSDMLGSAEIARILQNETTLEDLGVALVTQANENGGRDNISVVLTQASGPLKKRGLMSRLLGKP